MTTAERDKRAERAQWVADTVREVRAYVRPLERRYGCTSEEMWTRWQAGDAPEDEASQEEVFDWMMHWRLIRDMFGDPRYDGLIPPDNPADDEAALATMEATVARFASQWRVVPQKEDLAELEELWANVAKMEARYECTSEDMWNAVLAEPDRGTSEVCQWLEDYHEIQQILASDEYATLTGTATTDSSTAERWPASAVTES